MRWAFRRALLLRPAQILQRWRRAPLRSTLRLLRRRLREDHIGAAASSLTFTTLISLVPLMTVTLALFTAFPIFGRFQRLLEQYLVERLVPESIARPVLAALTQFSGQSGELGAAGLAMLLLSALALMSTIDRALNAIWRVPRRRPLAQRLVVYWAAATIGPVFLGASLSLTSHAVASASGLVDELPGGVGAALRMLQFGLLGLGVAALFRFLPNTDVRWSHALAGGVFVATGFETAKQVLGWSIAAVPTYSVIYGAFATAPIFLVWLYCSWWIVLLGAAVAAYAPTLQTGATGWVESVGWPFQLAVDLLRVLALARDDHRGGLSVDELAATAGAEAPRIRPLLDTLVGLDWIGRLDETGAPRYLLLRDPASIPVQPLVDALLLTPSPGLARFWQRTGLSTLTLDAVIAG